MENFAVNWIVKRLHIDLGNAGNMEGGGKSAVNCTKSVKKLENLGDMEEKFAVNYIVTKKYHDQAVNAPHMEKQENVCHQDQADSQR